MPSVISRPSSSGRRALPSATAASGPSTAASPPSAVCAQTPRQQVHARLADEISHKEVGRTVVDIIRSADLLERPVVHDRDAVRQGERLVLVVGHQHGGEAGLPLQALQLAPGGIPLGGIEVGQRLVQQQHRRRAHDGAGQADPLLLAAGQAARLAVQQVIDTQPLSHVVRALAGVLSPRAPASRR